MKTPAIFAAVLSAVIMLAGQTALASSAQQDPHQLVEVVTETVLEDIARYRDALDEAADRAEKEQLINRFFDALTATLEPVVDFRWIALNVMGSYRQEATPEQKKRFSEVFTRGLVETYGRGLLSYSDQKIVVQPPDEDIDGKRRVSVVQEIKGEDATYPLIYSMGLNRNGEWKVVNVIINGINLGSTFRNQFAQAYQQHDGNLDKVIENWAYNSN